MRVRNWAIPNLCLYICEPSKTQSDYMKYSTKSIRNDKMFETELKFIDNISLEKRGKVELLVEKEIEAFLRREKETYLLQINARLLEDEGENTEISFIFNDVLYKAKKIGSTARHTGLKVDKSISCETTLELNEFHSDKFKQYGLYKTFFETDIKHINTFRREFETVTHQRNGSEYSYDCIRVNLNEKDYDVTQLKYNEKGFYIFECLQKQGYDEFSEVCFSIQQAIGFINKVMVGGEKFTFDDSANFYYSNHTRPSLKGMYSPITTNPYSYTSIPRNIADFYFDKLTRLTLTSLSTLVKKIHTEKEFSAAILVLLEATSLRSLLIIPSSFAVIIEKLSRHLITDEIGLEKPIDNLILAKKITTELQQVIDDNADALNESIILKLKRRLKEINRPTNKVHLTNNEKLTRPFEQLGIRLTLHDIAIIEHRNDLLHGNILLHGDEIKDDKKINLYLTYVSAKLFTLISKLILKSIGYEGFVHNQAKYLEKYVNINTDEEYFEKI